MRGSVSDLATTASTAATNSKTLGGTPRSIAKANPARLAAPQLPTPLATTSPQYRFMSKPSDTPETALAPAARSSYSAIANDAENDEDAWWLHEQRLQHKTLHWLQRPSALMVGSCVFLFMFASFSAEATRQMIQYKLACNSVSAGTGAACDKNQSQVLISSLQQGYSMAQAVATMIASGKVMPLSDKYGRKPFLFLLISFQVLGKIARYFILSRSETLHVAKLIGTEVLANCFGGVSVALAIANCYVSDIADAHQRTYLLGINMACMFVGLSTGPLAGNALLSWKTKGHSSPQYANNISPAEFSPLRMELVLLLFLLAFVAFVLPESRGEKARSMSRSLSRSSSQIIAIRESLNKGPVARFFASINIFEPLRLVLYPKDRVHRSRHGSLARTRVTVFALIVVDCLVFSVAQPTGESLVLYGIYKFNWTAKNLGVLLAVGCSSKAFVLIVLSPLLTHRFLGKHLGLKTDKKRFDSVDYSLVAMGYLTDVIGCLCFRFAPTGSLLIASVAVTATGSLATPALNSAVIKYFPESMIGEVFGSMAILKNVFQLISPVALLGIYKLGVARGHPEVIFLVLGGIFAFVLLVLTFVKFCCDEETQEPSVQEE